MSIPQWQLAPYQAAAFAMCHRLGEDPFADIQTENGNTCARWEVYAAQMFLHTVRVETMRNYGFPT